VDLSQQRHTYIHALPAAVHPGEYQRAPNTGVGHLSDQNVPRPETSTVHAALVLPDILFVL
jgi:hypothetical protein